MFLPATIQRLATPLLLVMFVLVATFGVFTIPSMDEHGHMVQCAFSDDSTAVCPMNALQHLTEWKQYFTANFIPMAFVLLAMTVGVVFFFAFMNWKPPIPAKLPRDGLSERQRQIRFFDFDRLRPAMVMVRTHPRFYDRDSV